MHTPFLAQVASFYAQASDLANMAFVFPNRRSSQQFEHLLGNMLDHSTLMPRLMSMNDFIDHVTRRNECIIASSIETMFIAHKAYVEVMGDNASEFDKFAYWGQLIVNDFNDVDMNLVNARDLYRNLADLRNIAADYIDDEDLRKAIRSIFNINLKDGEGKMWKGDAQAQGNDIQKKYFTLWDRFADIYDKFGELMQEHGLTTQGKLYREAVDIIKNSEPHDLGFSRIVMVGHDALSVSELSIFNMLKNKNIAHFWWDNASSALKSDANPAKTMITTLAKTFAPPMDITPVASFPSVTVHNIPSVIGQAKCVFENISKVSPSTAIVLPDEALLEPLLTSLPDDLLGDNPTRAINITMGYPLRKSNIVTLMHLVATAHKHAMFKNNKFYFYREDVRDILSHPIIKTVYTAAAISINNAIDSLKEFNIPAHIFVGTPLEPIFTTFHTTMNQVEEVKNFITALEAFCNDVLKRIEVRLSDNNDDDDINDDEGKKVKTISLQGAFIKKYMGVLTQLRIAISNVGLPVHDTTIFHLIDRMTSGAIVPFDGHYGVGIQVMGLLETRCIDFDNINILSANEDMLPRRSSIQSLIPDRFRAAFNMPTTALNDAIEAYRFYRLISRATHVNMLYDSSNSGRCEPSRFITQLSMVYGVDVKHIKRTANVTNIPELPIEVLNSELKDKIKRDYTTGDPKDTKAKVPCLSASSINEFINCPLKYYFHHLQHLKNDNDVSEFMDSSTFGTIVHDTLQECYDPLTAKKEHFRADDIQHFIGKDLNTVLTRNINKTFLYRDDLDAPLTGQAVILFETLKRYVLNALHYDKERIDQHGKITIVECEVDHRMKLDLGEGTAFNFTFKADRVERQGGVLRIIDYKTGNDVTSVKEIDNLFTPGKDRAKAVLQLLLYSVGFYQEFGAQLQEWGITAIEPVIYKLREMSTTGVFYKSPDQLQLHLHDFYDNPILQDYLPLMRLRINELFDPKLPFKQDTVYDRQCSYCHFADFCRR